MRYFRQPDQYSCGPTAIANALVWGGVDVKIRQLIPLLKFSCQTIDFEFPDNWEANGTMDSHFDRTLRYASKGVLKVRRSQDPTTDAIKEHLLSGGAVALGYYWKEGDQSGEHYVFISEFKKEHFVFINDHDCRKGRTSRHRSIKRVREYLKNRDSENNPAVVWYLTRKAAESE